MTLLRVPDRAAELVELVLDMRQLLVGQVLEADEVRPRVAEAADELVELRDGLRLRRLDGLDRPARERSYSATSLAVVIVRLQSARPAAPYQPC